MSVSNPWIYQNGLSKKTIRYERINDVLFLYFKQLMASLWKYCVSEAFEKRIINLNNINYKVHYYDEMINILKPVLELIPILVQDEEKNIRIYELGHIKPFIYTGKPHVNITNNISTYMMTYVSISENELVYIVNAQYGYSIILDIMSCLHEVCHILQFAFDDDIEFDPIKKEQHAQIFSLLLYLRMFKSRVSEDKNVKMTSERIRKLRETFKFSHIEKEDYIIKNNNLRIFDQIIYDYNPENENPLDSISFLDFCIINTYINTSNESYRLSFEIIRNVIERSKMIFTNELDNITCTYQDATQILNRSQSNKSQSYNVKLFASIYPSNILNSFTDLAFGHFVVDLGASSNYATCMNVVYAYGFIISYMFMCIFRSFYVHEDFGIKTDQELMGMNEFLKDVLVSKYEYLMKIIIKLDGDIILNCADVISNLTINDNLDFLLVRGNLKPREYQCTYLMTDRMNCGIEIIDEVAKKQDGRLV